MGRRDTCTVDLTEVSPLVRLEIRAFTVGQAVPKVASSKVAKHEKAHSDNQHTFIPFTFDIFGFLSPEVVDHLKRVSGVMDNNIRSHRSMDVVFKRIDFVIQKRLSVQLVVRLSSMCIFFFVSI
jgi:hypothetical protein